MPAFCIIGSVANLIPQGWCQFKLNMEGKYTEDINCVEFIYKIRAEEIEIYHLDK